MFFVFVVTSKIMTIFIIIMTNIYGYNCTSHGEKCTHMCAECCKFICPHCEDPHFSKQLPSWLIDKFIKENMLLPLVDKQEYGALKLKLFTKYKEAESALRTSFEDSLKCIEPESKDSAMNAIQSMNINDNAMQILRSLADSNKSSINGTSFNTESYSHQIYNQIDEVVNEMLSYPQKFKDASIIQLNAFSTELIHYCSNGGNTITLFDPKTNSKSIISLSKEFNTEADSISFNRRIFSMGGAGPSDQVYEVNLKSKELLQKAFMLLKKNRHSLCKSNKNIYSIGGTNLQSTYFPNCETYSVAKDKWTALPNLQEGRHVCAAFVFNDSQIFACAGCNGPVMKSTERIYLSDSSSKWEYVNIENFQPVRWSFHGIQISNSEAILFGGYDGYGNCPVEALILKIGKSIECRYGSNLSYGEHFWSSTAPIYDGKNVYGIDNKRSIHIFSIQDNKWSVVKQ